MSLSKPGSPAGRNEDLEAMMRASLIGHTKAVNVLLERGADVNARDENGWTPLMEAAFEAMTTSFEHRGGSQFFRMQGGNVMSTDDRDVLEVLKAELNFIEKGGYGKPGGEPWVSTSIFQDSPSCLNLGDPTRSHPCSECLLIDFVPPEDRGQVVPFHHIPLTATGETADISEGSRNQQDLEEGVKNWLRDTINRIEHERTAPQPE